MLGSLTVHHQNFVQAKTVVDMQVFMDEAAAEYLGILYVNQVPLRVYFISDHPQIIDGHYYLSDTNRHLHRIPTGSGLWTKNDESILGVAL